MDIDKIGIAHVVFKTYIICEKRNKIFNKNLKTYRAPLCKDFVWDDGHKIRRSVGFLYLSSQFPILEYKTWL